MIQKLRPSWLGPLAGLVAIATIIGAVVLGPGAQRPLRIVGGGIGLIALSFALWPILTLVRHGRPIEGESYLHTTTLVDSGLFSVVRHPQYLAYILFMLTFGLLAQHLVVTVLAILGSVLLYVNAVLEERECTEKLGQEYRDYMERVPRFNLVAGVFRRLRRQD
jgi:protein-S-isoprenylcysteine O-methyltransferase Ste14